MSWKTRTLGCLAGVATVGMALSLTAAPAQAAPWYSNPNSCTGVSTAVERVVSGRTVQVRFGNCGGTQHGWGRILGYDSDLQDHIRFEVDTNGDRRADGASWYLARTRNYTAGYPTSSSSNRAFRACFVTSGSATCTSSNATAWW